MQHVLILIDWCYNQSNYNMNFINANYSGQIWSCASSERVKEIQMLFPSLPLIFCAPLGKSRELSLPYLVLGKLIYQNFPLSCCCFKGAVWDWFVGSTWKPFLERYHRTNRITLLCRHVAPMHHCVWEIRAIHQLICLQKVPTTEDISVMSLILFLER